MTPQEKELINNKRANTCLIKYNKSNVMQVAEIKQNSIKTNLKKYGVTHKGKLVVTCPWCNESGGKMGFDVFHFNYCKMNPNRIIRNKSVYICPHCNIKSTNKSNMHRYHFDNCKFSSTYIKPEKKILTCPHCLFSGSGGNMTRYHFDNCKQKKGSEH